MATKGEGEKGSTVYSLLMFLFPLGLKVLLRELGRDFQTQGK